jgi:hypothetical protein
MDSRFELCFAFEDPPYIPERKPPKSLPFAIPCWDQWLIMWRQAENWRISREKYTVLANIKRGVYPYGIPIY